MLNYKLHRKNISRAGIYPQERSKWNYCFDGVTSFKRIEKTEFLMTDHHIGNNANGTVLVIDNDTRYRETLRDLLEVSGYRVIEVSTGQAAIDIINATTPPSLIFIDVRLKNDDDPNDMSGLRLIRELPGNIPVIVLTAHEDPHVVRAAYDAAPGVARPAAFLFKGESIQSIRTEARKAVELKNNNETHKRLTAKVVLISVSSLFFIIVGLSMFLLPSRENHEILVGTLSEFIGGTLSAYLLYIILTKK